MNTVLSSPRLNRYLPWFAAAVLAAGTVAVLLTFFRDSSSPATEPAQHQQAQIIREPKRAPVDPKAQKVAHDFIVTAVARKNLDKAWAITHPELRSGMTLKEWETGNIPVTPITNMNKFDTSRIAFRVKESFTNEVLLEVLLLPKAGAKGVAPQSFFIGLKANGAGKNRHWLVNYWMTSYTPPVRSGGEKG
jgi:hypothetical protein